MYVIDGELMFDYRGDGIGKPNAAMELEFFRNLAP